MITRQALGQYLNTFLSSERYDDYAPNGLQIEGKSSINRLCTAVTASQEVIDTAVSLNFDALLVHHGFFWRGEPSPIMGMKRKRIKQLLIHDMNLYAYHLPLDCHLELGNNACLAKLFNCDSVNTHKVGSIDHLLWSGAFPEPMNALSVHAFLEKQLHRKPVHIEGTSKTIKTLAWCSGGAQDYIVAAHELGVDAYISGEVSERTYYQAKELGIHYFACGHHATERYGIQALGNHLAKKFSLEHQFLDSANPI